jgi:Rrf2 family protein
MGFLITQATEVSLRFLIHLSLFPPDRTVSKSEVVKAQDVSPSFLTKVSQPLIKAGIVASRRGKKGGFTLAKPASEITLLDVLEVSEGTPFLNRCLIHSSVCTMQEACPMHRYWVSARKRISAMFREITIEDLGKESLKTPEFLRRLDERIGSRLPYRSPGRQRGTP